MMMDDTKIKVEPINNCYFEDVLSMCKKCTSSKDIEEYTIDRWKESEGDNNDRI